MGRLPGKLEWVFFLPEASEKRVLSYFDDLFIFAKPATLEKFRLRMTKLVVFKTCEKFSRRLFVVNMGFDSVEESERWALAVIFIAEIRGRMLEVWSFADRIVRSDAFDRFESGEFTRWDNNVWSSSTRIVQKSGWQNAVHYHSAQNDYSFDALQFDCFRINLKL